LIEDVREDVYAVYLESEHIQARRENRLTKHREQIADSLKQYLTAKDAVKKL